MVDEMKALGDDSAPSDKAAQKFLAASGYFLMGAAIVSFFAIIVLKVREAFFPAAAGFRFDSWLNVLSHEIGAVALLLVAIIAATLGKRMLTTVQLAGARTIPADDLPLVRDAVMAGKAEPIDQYVRLRALTGVAGAFTKLGVTGLPLTTVVLTLLFAAVSLAPIDPQQATSFMDLAKLTLGAFIGSFVQRQVEQRRQDLVQLTAARRNPELPT